MQNIDTGFNFFACIMLHHFDRHHQGYVLAPTSPLEQCNILDYHMKGIVVNHMIDKIIILPLSVLTLNSVNIMIITRKVSNDQHHKAYPTHSKFRTTCTIGILQFSQQKQDSSGITHPDNDHLNFSLKKSSSIIYLLY